MKTFSEILTGLENADHLQRIELMDADSNIAGVIENKPGSQGSLKVYHHLWKEYGAITSDAASKGLKLYAEHTADARANPGKHPNIDRLSDIINSGKALHVRCHHKINQELSKTANNSNG